MEGGVPPVEEAVLVKKFVSFVSVQGEDLLPQAEAENAVKFEMQAVLTCLRWRISRKKLSIAGFCT